MNIGACIITYNPDLTLLEGAIYSLVINNISKILVVDNGSNSLYELEKLCANYENVELIRLSENKGIATATNIALDFFIHKNFDFVLTSDQDSVYPEGYIDCFYKISKQFERELNDIAAFTPVFYDIVEQEYAPILKKKTIFMKKVWKFDDFEDVFHSIASGMMINLSVLKQIGGMNEDLFIDWVDMEWCWKAHFYGKKIICCKQLSINHHLGDVAKNLGYRKVSLRSYIRNYYITRNSFYLSLHCKYLKWYDRLILFVKSFQYIFGYTLLCDEHCKNFIYTNKAMFDAFFQNMGKINTKKEKS